MQEAGRIMYYTFEMHIQKLFDIEGAKQAIGTTVIIDVFRAASVDAYLLYKGVKAIIPVATKEDGLILKEKNPDYVLLGEEWGKKFPEYDMGNSPHEVLTTTIPLSGKTAVHRSSRGTQGIVNATGATEIIFGSFVTATAIANYIKNKSPDTVSIVAMDPGTEDEIYADYLEDQLTHNHPKNIQEIRKIIRAYPSISWYFDPNMPDFPQEDFDLCLDLDRFDFVPLLQNGKIIKYTI